MVASPLGGFKTGVKSAFDIFTVAIKIKKHGKIPHFTLDIR
jgi:hypothetical protein